MRSFDIRAHGIGDGTTSNALGLAVNPANGNIFLTTLSYSGLDNLWELDPNGGLVQSTRVAFDLGETGNLAGIIVDEEGLLYCVLAKGLGSRQYENFMATMTQDGSRVNLMFPTVGYGGSGIGYDDMNKHLFVYSIGDDTIYKINKNGVLLDHVRIRLGAADIAYERGSGYIFAAGRHHEKDVLHEYRWESQSTLILVNAYDLGSVGIERTPMALDISRANGLFYAQVNNQRVVEFDKHELAVLPTPDIAGHIDFQSAPLESAKVKLKQEDLPTRTTETDAQGNYAFESIDPTIPFRVVINGSLPPE